MNLDAPAAPLTRSALKRLALRVRGVVQGVGFRPFVFRLATSEGLSGFVLNDGLGVRIEVEGDEAHVARFTARLEEEAPPLARLEGVETEELEPLADNGFHVRESQGTRGEALIPADVATCAACLRELFDPNDRRHRYPFINCTDCGPRFTLVRDVPYDRSRTTMDQFPLCAACRAEYEDPGSRRFHAEPNACPECGPQLSFSIGGVTWSTADEALLDTVQALRAGRIVALKGLGGFLLAVDARRDDAIRSLRERKRRPHKPFAVMIRDLSTARRFVVMDAVAEAALSSEASPIVILPSREAAGLAPAVAPGLQELGVLLPYTPLHHLLFEHFDALVMTSGNSSDEPIARDDAEAVFSLAPIADALLTHDREIHARADDSVVRVVLGELQPVRRARGFVPNAIRLPFDAPPVVAAGAQLKNTICFTHGDEAVLSPHIGDLDDEPARAFFLETLERMQRLLGVEPVAVAHDLHPDFASTRWARESGLLCIPVQHHHAHLAACLAEHGHTGAALGVVFDGTGCGPSGELWGGELLLGDLSGFRRVAHLRPLPLPGGEAAIREPWRLAVAALADAGEPMDLLTRIAAARLDRARWLLASERLSPRATGCGRWFDAVASLCSVRDTISYEGQAAIELEALAGTADADPFPYGRDGEEIDLRPMIRALADGLRARTRPAELAARFHETLCHATRDALVAAREATRVSIVALSGGCFQNRRLTERLAALLNDDGFDVLVHRLVPPNDGGLSLGQAAVAAFRLQQQGGAHVPRHSR